MKKQNIFLSGARLLLTASACVLCFGLPPRAAMAQATEDAESGVKYAATLRRFEADVKRYMEQHKVPGLTIGFVKDDYLWVKGFGYEDLENHVPATANSSYRLASVSKTMTAVAVLQLVEQGKIDVDAPIQNYVPYFPNKPYPVTARLLLGHLGGIRDYQSRAEVSFTQHKTTRESIALFADSDLIAPPGTKYSYSNYGYDLLAAAVEGASKQTYEDYLRDHIWKPLGMTATQRDDSSVAAPHRVHGYRLVDDTIKPSAFVDMSSRIGSGDTRGTIVDLLRFTQGLNDNKLLTEADRDLMFTPMKLKNGEFSGMTKEIGYGMGWMVSLIKSKPLVFHSGGQAETRTFLISYPAKHFSLAFAMNLEDKSNPYALAFELFELILSEKWYPGPY